MILFILFRVYLQISRPAGLSYLVYTIVDRTIVHCCTLLCIVLQCSCDRNPYNNTSSQAVSRVYYKTDKHHEAILNTNSVVLS